MEPYELDDRLYCRMFDGRPIYTYMLLMEPHLLEIHASLHGVAYHRNAGERLDPLEWLTIELAASNTTVEGVAPVTGTLSANSSIMVGEATVSVGTVSAGGSPVVAADRSAVGRAIEVIRYIGEVEMSYLVELSVGAIVEGQGVWPAPLRPLFLAVMDQDSTLHGRARSVVRYAAEDMAWQWMMAEEWVRQGAAEIREVPAYAELASAFGEAVVFEFERRVREERGIAVPDRYSPLADWTPTELMEWLDTVPAVPFSRELFCYWYPYWWQAGFIHGAPTDYPRSLPLPGDLTASLADILELEERGIMRGGQFVLPAIDGRRPAIPRPSRAMRGRKPGKGRRSRHPISNRALNQGTGLCMSW